MKSAISLSILYELCLGCIILLDVFILEGMIVKYLEFLDLKNLQLFRLIENWSMFNSWQMIVFSQSNFCDRTDEFCATSTGKNPIFIYQYTTTKTTRRIVCRIDCRMVRLTLKTIISTCEWKTMKVPWKRSHFNNFWIESYHMFQRLR